MDGLSGSPNGAGPAFVEFVLGPLFVWVLYALPAALGVVPNALAGRKRSPGLGLANWAVLIAPFLVWWIVGGAFHHGFLSSFVGLPLIGVAVAAVGVGVRIVERRRLVFLPPGLYLAIACAIAAVVAAQVPPSH